MMWKNATASFEYRAPGVVCLVSQMGAARFLWSAYLLPPVINANECSSEGIADTAENAKRDALADVERMRRKLGRFSTTLRDAITDTPNPEK